MIRIEALSKIYPGQPRPALADVSLQLRSGEFAAIVGRSGAGKSTLARCLAGFERPSSGMIAIEGRCQLLVQDSPLSLNPRWTVAQALAEPSLLQGDPDPYEEARRAAAAAGFPEAYLARPVWKLSGGERQLVALSRALEIRGLGLLIADEPFTGLDEEHQRKLGARLAEVKARGVSLLLVTHSLAWVRRLAERVLVLNSGRLVEDQPAERFFSSPQHAVSQALLEAQLEVAC